MNGYIICYSCLGLGLLTRCGRKPVVEEQPVVVEQPVVMQPVHNDFNREHHHM